MKKNEALIELIREYEEYIQKGNSTLKKKFNLKTPPLLAKRAGFIPSSGVIETEEGELRFKFHGMGCRFEFDGIVVDFDYTFGDFVYKGFEPIKLFWFVESYPNACQELKTKDVFDKVVSELELESVIIKKENTSLDTYDYRFKDIPPNCLTG